MVLNKLLTFDYIRKKQITKWAADPIKLNLKGNIIKS